MPSDSLTDQVKIITESITHFEESELVEQKLTWSMPARMPPVHVLTVIVTVQVQH